MSRTRLFALWVAPLLASALAACSPFKALNAFNPGDAYQASPNLAYGAEPRQQLDIYAPKQAADLPVVVFFYGGSWNSGSRADYAFVGDALASRGIVAVIADYRLYPEVTYPAFVEDAARAVAWVRIHIGKFGGDPNRLFVAGHSAGAYNAAMVALDARWLAPFGVDPSILRGWIGIAGPYDFLPIENEAVKPAFHFPNTPPDSQPIRHVTADAPTTLLLAGTADTTVNPIRNTEGLAKALTEAGVPVTVKTYDGVGHAMMVGVIARPLRWRAKVLDDMTRFVLEQSASVKNNASAF